MKSYLVELSCEIPKTFFTTLAANSCDIKIEKKSTHTVQIDADFDTHFNLGVIVGASGTGKTQLAKKVFGEGCFKVLLDLQKPIIEQFPASFKYDDRVEYLSGVGLTQVPCWIRPAYTLSNGQRSRAECCLAIANAKPGETVLIDEYSSLVDRTVGKIMSHTIQKFARKKNVRLVLCSCHSDIIEYLSPDFVVDLDQLEYKDFRGLLRPRQEKLTFEIRKVHRSTWKNYSHLHYLSNKLPGGLVFPYGLFHEGQQIGFFCLANMIPIRKHSIPIYHCARVAVRPDFCGLGIALKFTNLSVDHFLSTTHAIVRATFSSVAMYHSMIKDRKWKFLERKTIIGKADSTKMRKYDVDKKTFSRLNKTDSFRGNCISYRFEWKG
jgi:hypothetical protein